jgi:hypothetical protein
MLTNQIIIDPSADIHAIASLTSDPHIKDIINLLNDQKVIQRLGNGEKISRKQGRKWYAILRKNTTQKDAYIIEISIFYKKVLIDDLKKNFFALCKTFNKLECLRGVSIAR